MATTIWKPGTKKGPVLLIDSSNPRGAVTITTPDGRTFTGRYLNTNEGRHQYVFPREVANYQNLQISANGERGTIANGSISYEGNGFSDWKARPKGSLVPVNGVNPTGVPPSLSPKPIPTAPTDPTATTPGPYGSYTSTNAPEGTAFPVAGTPPSFPTITPDPIPQINVPFTKPVNPLASAKPYETKNASQLATNFGISEDQASKLTQLDFDTLSKYFPAVANLQQGAVSQENKFNMGENKAANQENQQERLDQLETALPGARSTILGEIDKNKTLSEGRFLTDAEDRAYEVAARGASADDSVTRGFGDDSTVGKRQSDLLSASKRLDLTQIGEAGLDKFLSLGANLAFDQPIKFNPARTTVAQDLRGTPPTPASTLARSQEERVDPLTTLNPATGVADEIQGKAQTIGQNEFQANLTQQRNEFNSTQNVGTQQFNATGTYGAQLEGFYSDVFNAQQHAGAINQGHAVDTAQDNFQQSSEIGAASSFIGAATTVGSLLLKPSAPITTGAPGVPAASGATSAAETIQAAGSVPASYDVTQAGRAAKPALIALAAQGSGKSVEEVAQGGIKESDVNRALIRAGKGESVSGVDELLKSGISTDDVKNAALLANPMTSSLAAYDMAGPADTRAQDTTKRNALRNYASQIGFFEKGSESRGQDPSSFYAPLADGSAFRVSNDGKTRIPNNGVNVDGKTDRSVYQLDWSDPRTTTAVGYYNALGRIVFGKNWQSMAGHTINAAMSNNSSLSRTKDNLRQMATSANIDYRTGLNVLSRYKQEGEIPAAQFPSIVAGWNDLMLSAGVTREVAV